MKQETTEHVAILLEQAAEELNSIHKHREAEFLLIFALSMMCDSNFLPD